jgi:hypothetical protein
MSKLPKSRIHKASTGKPLGLGEPPHAEPHITKGVKKFAMKTTVAGQTVTKTVTIHTKQKG